MQLESQDYSDNKIMIRTGQAITTVSDATVTHFSPSSNQQLTSTSRVASESPKTSLSNENTKVIEKHVEKPDIQVLKVKNNASFKRRQTRSDNWSPTQDEPLDLSHKSIIEQTPSNDEAENVDHKPPFNDELLDHKLHLNLKKEFHCFPETTEPDAKSMVGNKFDPENGKEEFQNSSNFPANSCSEQLQSAKRHISRPHCQDVASFDVPHSTYPSFQSFASCLGPLQPSKDISFNSHQPSVLNDTLKHIGFFANVPAHFPNVLWKDPTKLFSSERFSGLKEPSLPMIEALQIYPWPNYFDRHPVLKSETQNLTSFSGFSFKSLSNNNNFNSQVLHTLPLNGASQPDACLSQTKFTRESPPHGQTVSSYEPSKHPLKRKLMMSATAGGSDNFRANSFEGEPALKSSPNRLAPTGIEFNTFRNSEPAGPTTVPQPCVI